MSTHPAPMPDAELRDALERLRKEITALLSDVRTLRDQTAEQSEAARRLWSHYTEREAC